MQAWALALCVLGGTNPFDDYVYDPLVGKAVVVIHDGAEFTTGDGNAGKLAMGEQLNVTAADGDVLNASFDGRAITLRRADVLLPPDAVNFFLEEIERSPSASAHFALGTTRQLLSRIEESIPAFDAALKLDPEMAKAYLRRGFAKLQQKEFDAALADLTEVINRRDQPGSDKTVPYAYLYRASCWQAKGDVEHAISDSSVFLSKNPNYVPVLLTRARLWQARGDVRETRDDYAIAVRLAPEDAAVHLERMIFLARCCDFGAAVEEGEITIRLDPQGQLGSAARKLAAVLLATCRDNHVRDGVRAVWHAEEYLRRQPRSADALVHGALAYAELGDFEKAINLQRSAITLTENNFQLSLLRASLSKSVLKQQLEQYEKHQPCRDGQEPALLFFPGEQLFVTADSVDLFDDEGRNVGSLWSNDVVKLERIDGLRCFVTCGAMGGWVDGHGLRAMGDGIECCDLALKQAPTARHYCNRAIHQMVRGDFASSLADHDRAVALAPESPVYLSERSVCRILAGNLAGGAADLERALQLDPDFGDAFGHRSIIKLANNNYAGALADLDEAIRIRPGRASHRKNRSTILMKVFGEHERALADLDEILRLEKEDKGTAEALSAHAWYDKRKGDFSKALAELNDAVRIAPDFDDGHSHLAWVLATCPVDELRNGEEALQHALTACRLSKFGKASALDALAAAYAELGDFDKAIEWQKTALELAADNEREEFASHLKEYQAGRPYRHAPKFEPPGMKLPLNSAKADVFEAEDRLSRRGKDVLPLIPPTERLSAS